MLDEDLFDLVCTIHTDFKSNLMPTSTAARKGTPRAAQPRVRAANAAVHTVLSVAATTRPVKVGAKPVGDSATVPAGLQVFQVLDDAYSRSALNALVPLKPGRPGPAG